LDPAAAGELLAAQAGTLAPGVRDRLLGEAGGNPLALLELPRTLTSQQLAGSDPLPERLPLSARLAQVFLQRVRRLPQATQTLLLVAAAEDTGELATILAAGGVLAVDKEALEPAEQVGLVQVVDSTLAFRHPLVRSAIYQAATFTARQAAHRALIAVLQGGQQAERRAWHLAAPPPSPLMSAPRPRRGRGHARAGRRPHPGGGTPAAACTLLLEGARLLLDPDPDQATELLVLAAQAALAAGELDTLVNQIHPVVARLNAHRPGQEDVRVQRVARSLAAAGLVKVPPAAIAQDRSGEAATTWPPPAFTWTWPMLILVEPAVDNVTADQLSARSVEARRAAGTVSALTAALANLMLVEASLGRWQPAISHATEGLRLARETGQDTTAGYFLAWPAWLAAFQGRAEDCRRLAEEALAMAIPRRLLGVAGLAAWTLANLDLTEGRPAAALERLRALATPGHPTAYAPVALLATGQLVDAAAQAGALEGMEPFVARFERWAQRDQRTWTLVVARRCRALITQGPAAEQHYQAALAVEGMSTRPTELARTELAYGQWLRRARRRSDARVHLRTALELFVRLGAAPWAERARAELRASGQTARTRDPSTRQQLTPQERQVAGLASQGLTNQQIAEQLFLSSHTVGYHLHKLYAKLEITSRADLAQLDLDDAGH
jgi:DNA-binding CsgD family transcriptional regulator